MKNFLKICIVAMILLSSSITFANDENISLKIKSDKAVTFYIEQAQDLDFSIFGSDNELLYTQKIRTKAPIAKTYNLEAFPDGSYLLKLESDSQITEYQLQIENGKATVAKPLITEKMKLVFTKENGLITLNLGNAPQGTVEVKILSAVNDELYSKTFLAKSNFTKTFDVAKVDAKELTFIVRTNNQEYIQTLQLN